MAIVEKKDWVAFGIENGIPSMATAKVVGLVDLFYQYAVKPTVCRDLHKGGLNARLYIPTVYKYTETPEEKASKDVMKVMNGIPYTIFFQGEAVSDAGVARQTASDMCERLKEERKMTELAKVMLRFQREREMMAEKQNTSTHQ